MRENTSSNDSSPREKATIATETSDATNQLELHEPLFDWEFELGHVTERPNPQNVRDYLGVGELSITHMIVLPLPPINSSEAKDDPVSKVQQVGAQDSSEKSAKEASIEHGYQGTKENSDKEASPPRVPSSFGSEGTTATTGGDGQLVHFSQVFTGLGTSGIFSLDQVEVKKPERVLFRLDSLESQAFPASHESWWHRRPDHGLTYGLRFPKLQEERALPKFEWDDFRWPRYEYEAGSFGYAKELKLTIQYFVHKGVLLQKFVLENCGNETLVADFEASFFQRMFIRDLDHADSKNKFNHTLNEQDILEEIGSEAGGSKAKAYGMRAGPGDFSWLFTRKIEGDQKGKKSGALTEGHNHVQPKDYKTWRGVAAVIALCVDGVFQEFKSDFEVMGKGSGSSWKVGPLEACQNKTFIMAYKMIEVSESTAWQECLITREELNLDSIKCATQVSPWKSSPGVDHSCWIPPASKNTGEPGDSSKDFTKRETMTRKLDLAFWSNLEHILSVCAIPVGKAPFAARTGEQELDVVPWEDVQPIALTCGDLSGHRICVSASLCVILDPADPTGFSNCSLISSLASHSSFWSKLQSD